MVVVLSADMQTIKYVPYFTMMQHKKSLYVMRYNVSRSLYPILFSDAPVCPVYGVIFGYFYRVAFLIS